jgi:hypothetical protein
LSKINLLENLLEKISQKGSVNQWMETGKINIGGSINNTEIKKEQYIHCTL